MAKIRQVGATAIPEGVQAVLCIRFTTVEKITEKNFSQGNRKVPAGYDSICPHGQVLTCSLDKAIGPGLPSDASGNLVQAMFSLGIYLPSCQDKR
jgi:hypothetical protein